jgi:hypothetical protein
MLYAHGYDHNFVLNKPPGETGITFAARAYDPHSGRVIDCLTTEPGVQIYTANGLNGSVVGSSGTAYRQTEAFTLETQYFPDSPNKPNFPTTELKPGRSSAQPRSTASPPTLRCRLCRGEVTIQPGRLASNSQIPPPISTLPEKLPRDLARTGRTNHARPSPEVTAQVVSVATVFGATANDRAMSLQKPCRPAREAWRADR